MLRTHNALIEENEILRERVRQLEAMIVPSIILPADWRMTRHEAHLLVAVRAAAAGYLTYERAMTTMYGMRDNPPCEQVLKVHVSKIRTKLKRARSPIAVETVWGIGLRMSRESCAAFDAAVADEARHWPEMGRAA